MLKTRLECGCPADFDRCDRSREVPKDYPSRRGTRPDTVRTLACRFRQQGMVGLLPAGGSGGRQRRAPRIPEAVRQEVDRLKALSHGFH